MKIGYWLGLLERVLLDANQNKTQTRKDGLASGDGDPLRKAIQSKCMNEYNQFFHSINSFQFSFPLFTLTINDASAIRNLSN